MFRQLDGDEIYLRQLNVLVVNLKTGLELRIYHSLWIQIVDGVCSFVDLAHKITNEI